MKEQEYQPMKKKWLIGGASFIAAAIGYYLASPLLAINDLKNSLADKKAEKVNQYIDYPALREDLKGQLMAAAIKNMQNDPDLNDNPFSGLAVAMIGPMINGMIDNYVTPAGMKTAMALSTNEQTSADETAQNFANRVNELNKALKKTAFNYEDLNIFNITATGDNGEKTKLIFARTGFAEWKLKGIALPQQSE